MPMYDFQCPAGHVTERLTSADTISQSCRCGRIAQRVRVNRVVQRTGGVLDIDSAETRKRFSLFREAGEELEHTTTENMNLWGTAKARANAMLAAGEAPAIRKEEVTYA